jgi:hypothetical protein
MRGAAPPFSQYAFIAWCLVEAHGQLYLLPLTFTDKEVANSININIEM